MKLRRAMAATAIVAPLALLSAPAAFATETPTTQPPTSSAAAATETPTTSAPTSTESSSSTPTTTPVTSPPASSQSATPSSASPTPTSPPATSAQPKPTPSELCPVDDNGRDESSRLSLSVSGLPGKIVAGSGWHTFTLTAANHSDQSIGTVQWLAAVDNDSMSDDESDWLSTYTQLEFFNPESKKWESLADELGGGLYFGETELKAKQTVDIKLRLDISAKAPVGDGWALGLGGYVDAEQNCIHSAYAEYDFTVLKPGSSNDNPGEATPDKDTKPPAGGKEPQGGAKPIPPTGSLAQTGSSSMLPTIGLIGGVAVVVGAGAIYTVRRRTKAAGTDAA